MEEARFQKKSDCYLDAKTKLEWSLGNYEPMSWETAMKRFDLLWRVPSIVELLTLVDYAKHNPATGLPGMVSSGYWSSTTAADYTSNAWGVYFGLGYGYGSDKSYSYYVRAVRG